MKVLAISSSPRPGRLSHTGMMLAAAKAHLSEVRPGWQWEDVQLWKLDIKVCDGNGRCFRREGCIFEDDAEILIEKMLAADGIVLASPNYCGNVNSTMMRFVERTTRLSHRRLLTGKGALAMSTSASPVDSGHAADYLRRLLGSFGASVVETCHVGWPFVIHDFDASDHGPLVRGSVDRLVEAVEDPQGQQPDEAFGVDVRQALRDNPEVAGRLFRSDARYFEDKERRGQAGVSDG